MRLLSSLFLLMTTPVLACKMTPLGHDSKSLSAAYELLMNKATPEFITKRISKKDNIWIFDLVKGTLCTSYVVKVSMPSADCSMRAELLSKKDCRL